MRINKKLLIISGIMVLTGGIISVSAAFLLKANDTGGEEQIKELSEKTSKISISADASDIKIIPSDTDKITLTYFTDEKTQYKIYEENGEFSMKPEPSGNLNIKWYDYIADFDVGYDKDITLKIPRDFKSDIALNLNYGDIEIENISGNFVLNTKCGDIDVKDVRGNLTAQTNYGDFEVENSEFTKLECVTDCGDIETDKCKTDTTECRSDYGECKIEYTSGNISTYNKCGDIDIKSISGKNITLKTDYGDIEGSISGKETDYRIDAVANAGSVNLRNRFEGENMLKASTDAGNIEIDFTE